MAKLSKGALSKVSSNKNVDDFMSAINRKDEISGLLGSLFSAGIPRDLMLQSVSRERINVVSRDAILAERYEMYEDPFVRSINKVTIARAIGVTHDNIKPFSLSVKSTADVSDSFRKELNEELKRLVDIIDETLLEVAIDSQVFGDGYAKREIKQGVGVVKMLTNFSTKPINIVPIITNRGEEVAYEVSTNGRLLSAKRQVNLFGQSVMKNGRTYASPLDVARMNSPADGIIRVTTEMLANIDNLNVFSSDLTVYEDSIYGGIMEDCKEGFDNYKWAIKALANTRISSSVVERFITHNLDSFSELDREVLKDALKSQLKRVRDELKNRALTKDPTHLVANHHIPTTGDAGNSVNIQESTPNTGGLSSIEDILVHIKRFLNDVGFPIELTAYGGNTMGGGERDGVIQNSLAMDVRGSQIRKAIRKYVLDTVKVHFLSKFNIDIDLSLFEVSFASVTNKSKVNAEMQRLEAITNAEQIAGLISSYKEHGYQDTDNNRIFLEEVFKPLISNVTDNKEVQLKAIIDYILTKPEQPNEEDSF